MNDKNNHDIMRLTADTIRTLTIDAVQKANIGHPGMPMGGADMSVVLWSQFLKHNPADPEWPDRDRFILSTGHGSMLLYSLLHLSGYDLSLDDIKDFRQWGSKTPGHPEYGHTVGVETTTGPLGQGLTNAVGFAIAEQWLAAHFNQPGFDIVDHHTYVIAGDGDMMEGVSAEASSLAGHLKLGKLIVLYDDNKITIDGSTDITFTEDVAKRYKAYGWHTLSVDGHDVDAVAAALKAAKAKTNKPSLILCQTHIGFGSPNKQDTSGIHGSPLGEEEIALTKANLGWTAEEPFYVPEEAMAFMTDSTQPSVDAHAAWGELFTQYEELHPALATEFVRRMAGDLPNDWEDLLPTFEAEGKMATRKASGAVLTAILPGLPELLGGSADLSGSNSTRVKGTQAIQHDAFDGVYLHYGVREHAMGGIMNALSLHGGIRPYGGTFHVFSDYMRGSMRLAALMNQPVVYVLTHDSIGLGEDGPTHQPIEQTMSLRLMPNMHVFRPADANETVVAWQHALNRQDGPTSLVLTRQGLDILPFDTSGAARGGYIINDADSPQAAIIATGSEVEIALAAQATLQAEGIRVRVVSLPCWSLFEQQSPAYRDAVLPAWLTARVAIEAGSTLGWERYTGNWGRIIGLDRFGASAPYQEIYTQLGVSAEAVISAVREMLS